MVNFFHWIMFFFCRGYCSVGILGFIKLLGQTLFLKEVTVVSG